MIQGCNVNIPYMEAMGSLMWAAVATQPDIAFAVSLLSQNPQVSRNSTLGGSES